MNIEYPHEIVSFYGTDGCGKSTIAKHLVRSVKALGEKSRMLGGSSYKEWLTPEVAKTYLGDDHRLGEVCDTPGLKTLLYEDIAIACYGLADTLKNRGETIAIDSDPFLKRIVWSTIENPDEHAEELYIERFNDRMTDHIGDLVGPTLVVGVNMTDGDISEQNLLDRITKRGKLSYNDPAEIGEMIALVAAVKKVWLNVRSATSGNCNVPALNSRLNGTRIISVINPERETVADIDNQAQNAALNIMSHIAG